MSPTIRSDVTTAIGLALSAKSGAIATVELNLVATRRSAETSLRFGARTREVKIESSASIHCAYADRAETSASVVAARAGSRR